MRSAPRNITDDGTLYALALRALMRRAHSAFELRTYLERHAENPEAARRVLARLKQEKFIDDARYALEFARSRARLRRQGRHRIARELRTRGVPDQHIEAALAETFAETDEGALVRKVIERRLRAARGPMDQRKTASLYGTLLRAGFDSDMIRRELRAAAKVAADDLPDAAAAEEV
jgi:regulatory protein